ncbi:hypothetical protein ACFX11_024350 [Malus domestica]
MDLPIILLPLQMEVGIEDCLHIIEFEYNKSQSQQEIPLLNLMFTIQRAWCGLGRGIKFRRKNTQGDLLLGST